MFAVRTWRNCLRHRLGGSWHRNLSARERGTNSTRTTEYKESFMNRLTRFSTAAATFVLGTSLLFAQQTSPTNPSGGGTAPGGTSTSGGGTGGTTGTAGSPTDPTMPNGSAGGQSGTGTAGSTGARTGRGSRRPGAGTSGSGTTGTGSTGSGSTGSGSSGTGAAGQQSAPNAGGTAIPQ
jgi:hypothetical protein